MMNLEDFPNHVFNIPVDAAHAAPDGGHVGHDAGPARPWALLSGLENTTGEETQECLSELHFLNNLKKIVKSPTQMSG